MPSLKISRFCFGTYQYIRYPLKSAIDSAYNLGFKNMEIWAGAPHLYPQITNKEHIKRLSEYLKKLDLIPYVITPEQVAYPFNIAAKNDNLRKLSMEYYKWAIELAAVLQAKNVLVSAGSGYFDEEYKIAAHRSAHSVYELAVFAQNYGIDLFYETLTPMSSNIVNTPLQLKNMLDVLPKNVFAVADLGQIAYMKQNIDDYINILGEKLKHIHLHDYGSAIHMALGKGILPIKNIINKLENKGFAGKYSLEINDVVYRQNPQFADKINIEYLYKNNIIN